MQSYKKIKNKRTWKIIFVFSFAALAIYSLINPGNGLEPTEINWQTLSQVKFTPTWYAAAKTNVDVPVFADTLQKLNGKMVEITGYYIPMEMNSNKCALSKNPNSSCFFCGGGTIETIMIVKFTTKMWDFDNDEVITIKGRLKLNQSYNDFIYNLTDAHFVRLNR